MSLSLMERLVDLGTSERSFAAGTLLFHQGDVVRSLHIVGRGEVHLVRPQLQGAQLILQRAGPNSILAEASIFLDRHHCDAVAVCATSTHAIDKGRLRDALLGCSGLAEAWMSHLAREVHSTRLRVEILSLRRVADRLDAWMVSNGGHAPREGGWRSVAAEIGVSPESLYRELAKRRA